METLRFNRLVLLACLISVGVKSVNCGEELADKYDIFRASHISGFHLNDEYTKINHLLCDETDSQEPKENFDIMLDYLIIDLKNNLPIKSNTVRAKRLFLALSTINDQNQCSVYSHRLLAENECAVDRRLSQVGIVLTRVERIILSYINEHANNCFQTYIDRFKNSVANLNEESLKRVEVLFDGYIETYTTKFQADLKPEFTKTPVHRLYNIILDSVATRFAIDKDYIQSSLKLLARNDRGRKFVGALDDEQFGVKKVNREKFTSLYDQFILIPCKYYISKLGPSIFELARFDSRFHHELQVDEVNFYTAWVRYNLCKSSIRKGHNLIDDSIKRIEADENVR